jgi:hypothetical protein
MSQFSQRGKVNFCQKLDKPTSETFQIIKQEYGEEALVRSPVFKWHKYFAQETEGLEDDERTVVVFIKTCH